MTARSSRRARDAARARCALCDELRTNGATAAHVHDGKRAMRKPDAAAVTIAVACSVDVEEAFRPLQERNEKVFDYLIVDSACEPRFVEVHPASSQGHVDDLIEKKRGTQAMCARASLKVPSPSWHWIVGGTGTVSVHAKTAHGKRLAIEGIAQPRRALIAADLPLAVGRASTAKKARGKS